MTVSNPAGRRDGLVPPDLSPTGKLVLLYLIESGQASVDDLKAALGIRQIRLYPTLTMLKRRNLIELVDDEYSVPD